jgi:protein-S-isoprenylcysteine O-methyltransferase Ste14
MIVGMLGFALLVPAPLAWGAWLVLVVALQVQVRAIEEPHLARSHGPAYRDYLREVGRFVPGLGRKAGPG